MNDIKQHLYSARWGISMGLAGDFTKLDYATDEIVKAKALLAEQDEPERPSDPPKDFPYELPRIVVVRGVRYNTHGHFRTNSGNAKGLIVHYTVSGRTPQAAVGVVRYLAKKGLGCPVMDENGVIYVPEGFDLQRDVAWHAGKSSWKGLNGMSQYCIGMEICCLGRRKDGTFERYTAAQEEALINFILWQLDVNPDFEIDYVLGHDEVSPGRKTDPGKSLSWTMPEFREIIKQKHLALK